MTLAQPRLTPTVRARLELLLLKARYLGRDRWRDTFAAWLAWLLPRRLVYWCAVRVGVHATVGRWSHQVVPELTVADALKRWRT